MSIMTAVALRLNYTEQGYLLIKCNRKHWHNQLGVGQDGLASPTGLPKAVDVVTLYLAQNATSSGYCNFRVH